MKWILNVLLFTILITSHSVVAADAQPEVAEGYSNYVSVNPLANMKDLPVVESKCATLDYQGTHVVNPKDYSICNNDISYGILEMVFQKVFEQNEILKVLAGHDTTKSNLAYAYNIGGPIIAIIEAITWLTFTLSGLVLTFVTIKTLNISASSGQFMGNWNSVYLMTRTLTAMALIVPIGSFSIAQILILVVALFAVMGGNYIWGAFLSMQQAGTVVLEGSGLNHLVLAQSQAESLVKTNTCSLRTSAASAEMSQGNLHQNFWYNVDVDEHMSRLSSCSRNNMYVGLDQVFSTFGQDPFSGPDGLPPGNSFPISTIAFGSPSYCNGKTDISNKYEVDIYGENYQCGNVNYKTADLGGFIDGNSDIENEPFYVSTKKNIVSTISNMKTRISPNEFYTRIANKGKESFLLGNKFNEDDYVAEVNELKTLLIEEGINLFDKIKSNIDKNTPNPPAAYEGTYVALSATFNNYLGGNYNSANYNTFWEKLKTVDLELWEAKITIDKAVQIYTTDERALALSPMYEDAKLAAGYVVSSHCARIWPTYYSSFDQTNKFLSSLVSESDEHMDENLTKGSLSNECIIPLNSSLSSVDLALSSIYYEMPNPGLNNDKFYLALAESNTPNHRDYLINLSNEPANPMLMDEAVKSIEMDSLKNANAIVNGMTAYNYVIRKATEDALKEIFVTKTDTDFLINMRNLGWASAGGFILALSNNGSDVNKFNKLIQSQVAWASENSNDKFIHTTAILRQTVSFEFNSMNETAKNVFSELNYQNSYEALDEKNVYDFDMSDIFKFLEDMLTSPLSHLKAVGGFDQNKTIRDGARECYEAGSCTITSVHPVTALLNVGNDLIELCFNLIILKTITGALVYLTKSDQANQKASAKSADPSKHVNPKTALLGAALMAHPVTRSIMKAVEVVDPILGVITSTIVPPLFIVGIFFSFIIPMMPFLAFLMGFIGWLMLIMELLIAVNVWILLMASPDQNGNSRADPRAIFSFVGQLVLKPGLMVVGLIFGWYLSAISVYFLNMTIFGALSPTETGSLIGLLDMFMFYIVYLIMIFVAIKHSFKIIEILPDKIFTLINVSKSGDVKSESLGMERLVQLAAGSEALKLVSTPMNMIDAKKEEAIMKLEGYKDSMGQNQENQALQTLTEEEEKRKALEDLKNDKKNVSDTNIENTIKTASDNQTDINGANIKDVNTDNHKDIDKVDKGDNNKE